MSAVEIARTVSRRAEDGVIGASLYANGAPMNAQQIAATFGLSPDTARRYLEDATPVNGCSPQRWSADDVRRYVVERGATTEVTH